MHQETIKEIVNELHAALIGRFAGRIFQLSPFSFALDFGLRDGRFLFVNASPTLPRLYLISRRARDLEKQAMLPLPFGQALRSNLAGGELVSIDKDSRERIVRFDFQIENEIGERHNRTLAAQLTGRSANLFLLDAQGVVTHSLRALKGGGQQTGERYLAPTAREESIRNEPSLEKGSFESLSAAADEYYQSIERAEGFASRAESAQSRIRSEIARLKKLQRHLQEDLVAHGDAEQHKRTGDLLLANIATAERNGDKVRLQDFYAEGEPLIELEVDKNSNLQDEAGRYFARYTKAKRAAGEIAKRLAEASSQLARLEVRQTELATIIDAGDAAALATFFDKPGSKTPSRPDAKKKKPAEKIPGTRRYLSSDGYEILVGRAARDNDHLTFRVARPHDLWLHAGDYPGSHVIVRNSSRKEFPQRTVIEAAQLAAKFSQASNDGKVVIHYTQRKFLSKPKGAAPGLVRMSTFRTVTVEPGENIERL